VSDPPAMTAAAPAPTDGGESRPRGDNDPPPVSGVNAPLPPVHGVAPPPAVAVPAGTLSTGQAMNSLKQQFTTQGFKMTPTTWLAVIGSGLVVIASFFPWWSASDTTLGVTTTDTGGISGVGRFFAIAIAVAVIALAWPAFIQGHFTRKRKVGLTVLVGALTLIVLLLSATASSYAKSQGFDNATVAFGVPLCWAGVVVIWVGVYRVWRSKGTRAAAPGA